MASWRLALAIAAAWGLAAGCAHSVAEPFEEGEGDEGTHRTADGAGGGGVGSTSADGPTGPTATSAAGPSTSAAATTGAATSTTGPSTSAQATSVAASSSSGGVMGCDGTGDCDTCAACAENGACLGPLDDCANDPNCSALAQCLSGCPSQACADQCFQQYQLGLPAYDQLYGCVVCGECFGDCDGASQGCM